MSQRHHAADYRPSHPLMSLGRPLEWLTVGGNFPGGLANRNSPGMGRPHHHAFENGLPADERLLATFQCREQLDSCQKTQILTPTSHTDWMILRRGTTPTSGYHNMREIRLSAGILSIYLVGVLGFNESILHSVGPSPLPLESNYDAPVCPD